MAHPEDRPVENRPVADRPVADRPVENRPVENRPVENRPVADRPVADRPVADRPVADRSREVTVAGNGPAIAALVLGLLAATYAFLAVGAIAAIIFGLIAIGFGVKGMGVANTYGGLYKGLAISGIVSGALGLLLGIAVIAGVLTLGQEIDVDDLPAEIQDLIEDATG